MKRRNLFIVLISCVIIFGLTGLTACKKKNKVNSQELLAPTVVLEGNIAKWQEDENAEKFELSVDGTLSYVENTVKSKALSNGQTLKVRAIGDGKKFLTSEWSNSVTYTEKEPDPKPQPQPTKLGKPTVTIDGNGVASWTAVVNASSYAYKINGGTEVSTTALSVQLSSGQTIVVKAVGDGENYLDGDYSDGKTYTQNIPPQTTAPTYLGITASKEEPNEGTAQINSSAVYNGSLSLNDALKNYFSNTNNALGEATPKESDYVVYSSGGQTVYIQIWLDNPDQNTILSLKLNDVKYQTGGGLQSFFIEGDGTYLNCVYVAVIIPSNSYGEIEYEVTEIEYVEGNNISQDGKSVLIDENDDTVAIGLLYKESIPLVEVENQNKTSSTLSFEISVTDTDEYVKLTGGWLRVVIYDRANTILGQYKLSAGNSALTFENLSAETYYGVATIFYGDTHDGNGVSVHTILNESYQTASVINCEVTSELLFDEDTEKYYPNISVEASLSDSSFEFTKVEVTTWSDEVVYSSSFDGSIDITEILNDHDYVIKVYYKNSIGVEQVYRTNTYVERLDTPWVTYDMSYGLIDDAILGFDFGNNKYNMDNLKIQIIDEYSKGYLAENAIYLIDNPNAISELESAWQNMDRSDPAFHETYDRWYKLKEAKGKIDDLYSEVTKTEWEVSLSDGIYVYEYVYGETENFFKSGNNKYFIVLEGYQSKRVNESSWKYILSADFDFNNGEEVENKQLIDGFFEVDPAISDRDYLFVASDDDYNELFTLNEDNEVYLEVMSRNNLGNESYRNLGYVNQIVLAKGYDIYDVLWSQDSPSTSIDEDAWLSAVKNAIINGEDVNSVFPLGNLEPISFDLDDVEIDESIPAGNYQIRFTYKMYGKTYTEEKPYDWHGGVIDYTIKAELPQVTIGFSTGIETFGTWSIESPDWVKNAIWNFEFTIEIKDESGQVVATRSQDDYGDYERLPLNYSIRVRLDSYSGVDYYLQGQWSEWFTCERIILSTPIIDTQTYELDGVRVEWFYVNGAEKFIYTVNDGDEQETYERTINGLKNGDKVKIKAVPSVDSNYAESNYCEVYTVVDTRTQLATPTNITTRNKIISWAKVENATYYEIQYILNGTPHIQICDSSNCPATIGRAYRIRACNEDIENYKASEWSADFTYTVTLETPAFSEVRSERVYWTSVDYAGGYNYKIGGSGEVTSTRNRYVALADIPLGEKLYVQAYAEGCESTAWVMIYHNVTVLATPSVTVSGGTATWGAIENATGYVYKINDGEEEKTSNLSVNGLIAGDSIVVKAVTTEFGYKDSDWSEVKIQPYTIESPSLDISELRDYGVVSWEWQDGASFYECELNGEVSTTYDARFEDIPYDGKFRVRAICESGEFERVGKWSEIVVREDPRIALETPTIDYDVEKGLTVLVEQDCRFVYKFGADGVEVPFDPSSEWGEQVITTQLIFPNDDFTVYVKAVPYDTINYKESEWATLEIVFE